jgi:exopolyphosphatase/guanosine-5'-triphosphate,3'-diphosphate pyrophosphatase
VDIGTNSVRLLIREATGQTLSREMYITRLGEGVDVANRLQPAALERTTRVLASYGALIEKHAVSRVRAAATSAARDADNREQFFDAAESALGTRPELLSGEDEAALSFQGATQGVDVSQAPFLVIDIGGGSTEFVLGERTPHAAISVPLGCVRMTERHIATDPADHAELEACAADVRRILADVRARVDVSRAITIIGVAGTITSLAHLQQGCLRYAPELTHHSRLAREDVEVLCGRLASAPLVPRRALLADPKRAEVIVAGAVILRTIMREFAISELVVSETDILDGLAASLV